MAEYKTPGVYIKEKHAFGTSVVEAETAIPAFIGFTEKAKLREDGDLNNVPWKISSMNEFVRYFGEGPKLKITVKIDGSDASQDYKLSVFGENGYPLYQQIQLFFANGGGTCYVVSVRKAEKEKNKEDDEDNKENETPDNQITSQMVDDALEALTKEREVTLIVVPEAVLSGECANIQQSMMKHCGEMGNRFAILDVPTGDKDKQLDKRIEDFQNTVTNYFSYGAAYFPWLNTTVLTDRDLNGELFTWDESVNTYKDKIGDEAFCKIVETFYNSDKGSLHSALYNGSSLYKHAIQGVLKQLNLLLPSATMAGIYTMVDHSRGVWKAPANITDSIQADLNMPMNGKAINALRTFPGEGIKVWGARTLDGNSQDWRYINVRRTMSFLEISVKNAARAFVFEPNNANTWINMKCMIENFLRSVWKRGGLAGSTPEEAYEVHVGLGDTMTADDILEGILRVRVLVAVSRPAEFVEITFQQQMQKS